jgi:hypothetical protein
MVDMFLLRSLICIRILDYGEQSENYKVRLKLEFRCFVIFQNDI